MKICQTLLTLSKCMGHGQSRWDKVKLYETKPKCDGTKSQCMECSVVLKIQKISDENVVKKLKLILINNLYINY